MLWQMLGRRSQTHLTNTPKIFVIGFNKCGTKTFHHFFKSNGLLSAHCNYDALPDRQRTRLANTIQYNIEHSQPILAGMSHFQAFSDLIALTDHEVIEANSYFREMYAEYPDAFFILNDRPVESWINSRLNHEGGPSGSFARRYASACGISQKELPDFWRNQYTIHKNAVLDFFKDHHRFLHFDITKDSPVALTSFFGNVIPLKTRYWIKRGDSAERARRNQNSTN